MSTVSRWTIHVGVAAVAMLATLGMSAGRTPLPQHCTDPRSRQFDFWLGSFTVRNYAGKLQGTDTIRRAYGGCVIEERFGSSDGNSYGSSFSFFDLPSRRWHYVWVDNLGAFELFSGGRIGADMVMTEQTRSSTRKPLMERMTWAPLSKGRIRQLWEASFDGGRHWRTISDVYYWPRSGSGGRIIK